MTAEAIVTDLLGNGGDPIAYDILDGTTCPKGSVMELMDLRTVQTCSATNKPIAGILAYEKVADDGTTQASVITNCVAKMVVSGAGVTHGNQVVISTAANYIKNFETDDEETGDIIGYALETGSDGETVFVRVNK